MYVVLSPYDGRDDGKHVKVRVKDGANRKIVRVFRLSMTIENGVSTTKSVQCAYIGVAPAQVQDVKFVDDDNLILAVKSNCTSYPPLCRKQGMLTR